MFDHVNNSPSLFTGAAFGGKASHTGAKCNEAGGPPKMTRDAAGTRRSGASPSSPLLAPLPAATTAPSAVASPAPAPGAGVPPRARRGRHSSKFGTVNYSVDEMRRLNDKVRGVMPVSSEEWLHVAYQFNYMRPESIPYREVDSLKRKFKKMYCARRSPRGEPLPEYLEDAKELRRLIGQRSDRPPSEDAQSDLGASAPEDLAGSASQGGGVSSSSRNGGDRADEELRVESLTGAAEDAADAHAMTAKLRQLEEEYHRSVDATAKPATSGRESAVDEAVVASSSSSSSSSVPVLSAGLSSPLAAVASATMAQHQALLPPGAPVSTSGVISMLKHSIERKRRTVEEQMLHESARVRRERKKRKTEQTLYSIHQEQREREAGDAAAATGGSPIATLMVSPGAPSVDPPAVPSPQRGQPPSPSRRRLARAASATAVAPNPPPLLHSAIAAPSAVLSSFGGPDASSLGLMEIMLQYMTAQQLEMSRRFDLEEERRQREQLEREERRRAKEHQRKREHQELMVALSALLGSKFPASLRHYISEPLQTSGTDSDTSSAPPLTPDGLTASRPDGASVDESIRPAPASSARSVANTPQGRPLFVCEPDRTRDSNHKDDDGALEADEEQQLVADGSSVAL